MEEISCAEVGAMRYQRYELSDIKTANTIRRFKDFDLHVGDIVQHKELLLSASKSEGGKKTLHLTTYEVIGIYPTIFHCRVLSRTGGWCESFKKIDYQLGEVVRIRGAENDSRTKAKQS